MNRLALLAGALAAFVIGFGLSACQPGYDRGTTVRLDPGTYQVASDQEWLDGAKLHIEDRGRSIRIEWPSKDLDAPYLDAELELP